MLAYAKRQRRTVSDVIRELLERGISKSGEDAYERDNAELRGLVETVLIEGRERRKAFQEAIDIVRRLVMGFITVSGPR